MLDTSTSAKSTPNPAARQRAANASRRTRHLRRGRGPAGIRPPHFRTQRFAEETLNPLGERPDVQRLELGIFLQRRYRMQPGFGHGSAGRRDTYDHLTQVAPARTRLHDGDTVDPLDGVEAAFVQQAVGVAADDQINGAYGSAPASSTSPAPAVAADTLARLYPKW